LLGLLFLSISHLFFYVFGSDTAFWLLKGIFRRLLVFSKPSPRENAVLRKGMLWRKYIVFNPVTKQITAGERIEELYAIIETFASEEEDAPVELLKDSLIRDAWQLCFAFSIIYFVVPPFHHFATTINHLIIAGLVLIPYLYVAIDQITAALIKRKANFLHALRFLVFQRDVYQQLNELGSTPYTKNAKTIQQPEYIRMVIAEYLLVLYDRAQPIDDTVIKHYLDRVKKMACPMVVFSQVPPTETAGRLLHAVEGDLTPIHFPDEIDIKGTFWKQQMEKHKMRWAVPFPKQPPQDTSVNK
jgi:hypothetical protein